MLTWFARISDHAAFPLVILLLANVAFYVSIASALT